MLALMVPTRRYLPAAISRTRVLLSLLLSVLFLGFAGCKSDEQKLAAFQERGDEYRKAEKYKEAIIEYRNVLQIDPNHAPAHAGLAEAYLKSQQFKEGYWELGESVRLDPNNVEARNNYAALSLAAERYDEVLEQSDAIIALDPKHFSAWVLRSQALSKLDRAEEAEQSLLKAIELEPEKASLQILLAMHYEGRLRLADAEAAYRKSVALEPSSLAWTGLGRLLFADPKRDAETEEIFKKAIEVAHSEQAAGKEKSDLAGTWQNLASFYFQRQRPAEGVAALEQGIEQSESKLDLIYQLARYLRRQGENEKADALMQRATEVSPASADPHLMISARKASLGDLEGALAAAEAAINAEPGSERARLRKAEILIDLSHRDKKPEQTQAAREILATILKEKPDLPEALFVRGKLELSENEIGTAVETLRRALEAKPNWAQAHFLLGSALILNGERPRARAELARSVELDPNLLEARRLLTQIHAQLGEHEYAIEQGRIYLKANPKADDVRIQVAQSLVRLGKLDDAMAELQSIPEARRGADAYYATGRLLAAQGKLEPARTSLLKANEIAPNNPKLLGTLFSIDRALGKPEVAGKMIADAAAAKPDSSELAQLTGLVALSGRDLAGAEAHLKRAIELDSKNLEAYQQLAGVLRAGGRAADAITLYEKAVAEKPESAGAHHFLAVLYESEGNSAKAASHYEEAIRYDANMGESKNNLAYLLAEGGRDLDRALDLAQEAKALMPDNPNTADTLGWVLLKRGVPSAAVGYLREAVEGLEPDSPASGIIRSHLALAYEKNNEPAKAVETLEKALAELGAQKKRSSGSQGASPPEPDWAREARESIQRLKAQVASSAG